MAKNPTKGIGEYKVGDLLWRYVQTRGVFKYRVHGVRVYENEIQLEVTCESCSHGWKCELLLSEGDHGKLKYVRMLNNDEDNDQSYWHIDLEKSFDFYDTEKEAKLSGVRYLISDAKEQVRKAEDLLKQRKEHLAKLQSVLDE